MKLIAVLYAFDSEKSIIILERTNNEIDIYDDILNLVGALQYIFLIVNLLYINIVNLENKFNFKNKCAFLEK